MGPDTTASQAVLNQKEARPRNCDGSFLSARNQRSVLYSGDDQPRLWTGEPERTQTDINPAAINVPFPGGGLPRRVTGYLGSTRIDYPPDDKAAASDVEDLRNAGGARFNPDDRVSVNFKKATIDYVLKQMLGGALGLNYVAPDDLGGSITFRTEDPLPKGQVLQVVRDLLARNGLEMRKLNGVYQIGKPELIASMLETGSNGRAADRTTRVVRLRKSDVPAIIGLARQLLPPEIGLVATNSPDTLLITAVPADIDGAEATIRSLASSGIGDDHTAIIQLRQSAPDKIAAQLNDFYKGRGIEGLTIVPLERQQAILVATRDATNLLGVKQLARAMDAEVHDEIALRLIPLKYLKAADVAERLAGIFGGGGGNGAGGGRSAGASSRSSGPGMSGTAGFGGTGLSPSNALPTPDAADLAPSIGPTNGYSNAGPGASGGTEGVLQGSLGNASSLGNNGGSSSGSPFGSLGRGAGGSFGRPTGEGPSGGASGGGGSSGGGGGGGDADKVKIVADQASNSVMIYSTYAVFRHVRDVLKVLDVPQAQVVIEATIVEVTLNDQLQQGVQFFLSGHGIVAGSGDVSNPLGIATSATSTTTGTTTGTTGSTTGTTSGTTNGTSLSNTGFLANNGGVLSVSTPVGGGFTANAVIAALQGITRVKVISSPYLTVTNGKEARLVVGDQIPYSTRTQSSNNLGNNTTTNEVTIKDTGIVLDISPDIHADNEVELRISQSVSTPNASSPLGGTLTPVISTRSVDSDVLLQSGHTVLLGGLIQDRIEQSEGGVPVLRTAPLVGDLFKSQSDSVLRTELILLLTPRVTRTTSQIENLARLVQAQVHTR